MAQRDRETLGWSASECEGSARLSFPSKAQVAKCKLIADCLLNRTATTDSKRHGPRGLGAKESVNKQSAQSKRVHGRRAFLVIVEIDVDIAISALPKNNRLTPGSQHCG